MLFQKCIDSVCVLFPFVSLFFSINIFYRHFEVTMPISCMQRRQLIWTWESFIISSFLYWKCWWLYSLWYLHQVITFFHEWITVKVSTWNFLQELITLRWPDTGELVCDSFVLSLICNMCQTVIRVNFLKYHSIQNTLKNAPTISNIFPVGRVLKNSRW